MRIINRLIAISTLILVFPVFAGNIISGSNTCASSGNKAVSSSAIGKAVSYTIQAPSANTGQVYIGGSAVSTTSGVYLSAAGSYAVFPQGNAASYDLTKTYFACTVGADTITWTAFQ